MQEERDLLHEVDTAITQIAENHRRTKLAIQERIQKLGIFQQKYGGSCLV